MSDRYPDMSPEEAEELVSAFLDGEATAEEVALVAGDQRLLALVEELQAIRDLVATPVELPSDEVREQMISEALAHRAPVVPMATARRRLRSVPPRARAILAAAAVVAAIAVVGVTMFDRDSDDDMLANSSAPAAISESQDAMEAAPEVAEESMDAAPMSVQDNDDSPGGAPMDEAAPEPESDASEETSVASPAEPLQDASDMEEADDIDEQMGIDPLELEDTTLIFDTEDELVNHVIQITREPLVEPDQPDPSQTDGCPQPDGEELDFFTRFPALVEGVAVEVTVFHDADGLTIQQTTPLPTCDLISDRFIEWGK